MAGSIRASCAAAILVALGKRDPAHVAPTPQPKAEPLEELVLELTDLKFHEQDGVRRPSANGPLFAPCTVRSSFAEAETLYYFHGRTLHIPELPVRGNTLTPASTRDTEEYL